MRALVSRGKLVQRLVKVTHANALQVDHAPNAARHAWRSIGGRAGPAGDANFHPTGGKRDQPAGVSPEILLTFPLVDGRRLGFPHARLLDAGQIGQRAVFGAECHERSVSAMTAGLQAIGSRSTANPVSVPTTKV